MTRLSNYKLKPQVREKLIENFVIAILKNRSHDRLLNFLKHLLTTTEFDTFAKRLEIVKELRRGLGYLDIKDNVKVTNATITKMGNILKQADDAFLKPLDDMIKEEEQEKELERRSKYSKGSKQVYARRIR